MTTPGAADIRSRLIEAMRATFGDDRRRIDHALSVLGYAERILQAENADATVVTAAAVLHDIGIHEAERVHGSSAGRYQEMEGPPIARRIMEELELDEKTIEHACRIVGSHHSAGDIDTPEFCIIWDADWLVNIRHEKPGATAAELGEFIGRVFKTETGAEIARDTYVNGVGRQQ